MFFSIERKEAEIHPWWYGYSYRDWSRNVTIMHPIPFNWFVRIGRNLILFLQEPRVEDRIGEKERRRWKQVWDDAFEKGKRVGYNEGYMDREDEFRRGVEKAIQKHEVRKD